jgi:catechol 2,3-dioxygenase-like lactoylglutathione lyase family enzyme
MMKHTRRSPAGIVPGLALTVLSLLLVSATALAVEVDLTRHLATVVRTAGQPNSYAARFFGTVDGDARIIVTNGDGKDAATMATAATVFLNGKMVVSPERLGRRSGTIEVPVSLLADNEVTVQLRGKPGARVTVRVKQVEDVNLNIVGRIHFQVNATDFAASKAFYQNFGFLAWIPFPPTNTLEVAQAVGLDAPYLIKVEVGLMVTSADGGLFGFPAVDLIQWFEPWRPDPPYASLNHLGMARFALKSADLAADMSRLQLAGVDFLTQPALSGKRFAIFRDPDGVYGELVEDPSGPGVAHVNVNVSDFERSRAFYRMLGLTSSLGPAYIDTPQVAALLGASEPLDIEGELIQLPFDGSVIELVQWKSPFDPEPAYPPPINHLGINRMAYFTLDLEGDVARLKAQGVQFLSEIAPCCSGPASTTGIVAFHDPDGTFIELLGAITPP